MDPNPGVTAGAGAAPGVRLQGLRVRLGGTEVLHGIDLDVRPGEFLVLLGPSGCGKSTLLHAVAGLHEVAAGRVEIGGRDLTGADPAERNIGMVFQSYALYPTMSVEANLSFGLRVRGAPRALVRERVASVAQLLQLAPLLRRKPSELSGGQRQRVAIGRALVRDAHVFLFDEPLSNLDAQLRSELRRELKELHARLGATMIYVTHDQVEAMTLADRVVILRAGRIQQVGAPAEVYERPANRFVAGFLGSPGMNLIEGEIHCGAQATSACEFVRDQLRVDVSSYAFTGARPPSGTRVLLGVRPEHVRLVPGTSARVGMVEPMGSHRLVWVDAGPGRVCVQQGLPAPACAPGDKVELALDAGALSLFRAEGDMDRL